MTLVDTTVWADHVKKPVAGLVKALEAEDEVLMHPFVFGELFLGSYRGRDRLLSDLSMLQVAKLPTDSEVLEIARHFRLQGSGIGWVDCHLLASARLSGAKLMTHDLALKNACIKAGVPRA
jgi:predicted nucleic acid-binding protein